MSMDNYEGLNLRGGAVISVCRECKQPFADFSIKRFGKPAHTCPTCSDVQQKRPSIVLERECLHEFLSVEIKSLPSQWQKVSNAADDYAAFKIDIDGSRYGAQWNGRIVIYAAEDFAAGVIVDVRAMVARHKTKIVCSSRRTMKHGEIEIEREVGINADEGEETILERPYIMLERSAEEIADKRLVWAEAHTKTTLKGYGRQYWASVSGSPLFEWRIGGGARSGRFHSTGILAVVDDEHFVIINKTGNIAGEEIYK